MWVCIEMRFLERLSDTPSLVEEMDDQMMRYTYKVLQHEDLPLTDDLPVAGWEGGNSGGGW